MAEDGIAADWVAKGFEPGRFEGPSAGAVSYGSVYTCRIVAERAIVEAE